MDIKKLMVGGFVAAFLGIFFLTTCSVEYSRAEPPADAYTKLVCETPMPFIQWKNDVENGKDVNRSFTDAIVSGGCFLSNVPFPANLRSILDTFIVEGTHKVYILEVQVGDQIGYTIYAEELRAS